jgi:hypothetical protein
MTKDELKKQLHGYRDLVAEREQIAQELAKIEAAMTGPKGTNWDGMPRGSSSGDPILGVVARHIHLQERYQAKLAELAAAQATIEELIDSLGDADAVRIALGDWGSFHMGWVPMRQFGALNAANWSSGSGVFVYTPLAVYLAQ